MHSFLLLTFLSIISVINGQTVVLTDPTGDDKGPGSYEYPLDLAYKSGSFDLKKVTIRKSGSVLQTYRLELGIDVNAQVEDVWRMGGGFSLQMIFIFIDTDLITGSGFTTAPPGLNISFDPQNAWDKCIIISPQSAQRVQKEIETKLSPEMAKAIIIAKSPRGSGQHIRATADWPEVPGLDQYAYQVIMQVNDGFPLGKDLLTRRIGSTPGIHRFGGGADEDCEPNVLDILAGKAKGEESEKNEQYKMLQYACAEDGSTIRMPVLRMVKP
ncbi:MAG: hypothetical protein JNL59_10525 [Chitinophagaceae bacterium]|jgi:hypothetical protein|nr:hypothetical protein [Chitinophagaceae bacterium]